MGEVNRKYKLMEKNSIARAVLLFLAYVTSGGVRADVQREVACTESAIPSKVRSLLRDPIAVRY